MLAYMLQSAYMTAVTYACFLGSVAGSSGILYLIIVWVNEEVSTTAPALMTPIGLAMSIDYCLFMMSRYRTERQSEWDAGMAADAAVVPDVAPTVVDDAPVLVDAAPVLVDAAPAETNTADAKQMQSVETMKQTAGVVVSS